MARAVQPRVALLLLLLCTTCQGIDPEDPDEVAPAVISVYGSDLTEALLDSSQKIRTLLATSWGFGLSVSNFTSSLTGIQAFTNGTCDVLVSATPLSESQAAPLTQDLNRTIMQIPFAVGSVRLVHSWQDWVLEGKELRLTPDALAGIYQCNISHLDDPQIQSSNPDLRLPHVPLAPMAERGGPEENILMRTLAELAPSWRQGVDHAKPLPQCVQEPNVTYEDFLQNDTFYFAIATQAQDFWKLPSVVLQLPERGANSSALPTGGAVALPSSGSAADEWASYSLIGADTGADSSHELRSFDFLVFFIFDHDSISRGYPVGDQIRELGDILLSENIQSQLPAFNFRPLSSLNLPPATVEDYRDDVQSVLCKSVPDMPCTVVRGDSLTEQLAIQGPAAFTALMQSALKPYKQSVAGWSPFMQKPTVDMYRYPKRSIALLISDDAVMSKVLLAKDRVGEPLVQVPFAMDAAMVAHSLPGVDSDSLCMDASLISDILQCRITSWNHRNISALNPGIRLPDQPINVTVDSSSLALIHSLTKYLNSLAPGWALGQGCTVRWPPCVYVQTTSPSPDSTSYLSVIKTNYTIGFQQLSAAGDGTLGRSIRVMNRAGACVSPHNITAESLESLNISSVLPQQWQNFTTASSNDSRVYPLGMMGFMVWDVNSTNIGYEEGKRLKNITSWMLSNTIQDSMPQFGLVPTYQNASAQIAQTVVQATPDADSAAPGGIPFNDTVTGCSSGNGFNSFEAVYWQLKESRQGRPFLLDTTYGSDTDALKAFLSTNPDRGQDCDFALVWDPVPAKDLARTNRLVMQMPFGFAPMPIIHNFQGIPNNALRVDAHALAGLYSCKIQSFDGYIQSLNPNLTLPSSNITVVAMPRTSIATLHLISYIKQSPLWDADLDRAPGWPPCVLEVTKKPLSGRISQLMLERPNSMIGFQPIGLLLTVQILAEQAKNANQKADQHGMHSPQAAVWNKVLNGMWNSNSALPLERSVLVQNAAGQFVATQPVDSLDFPFTKDQLPDSFMSPAWSHVQDPTSNKAPNAYPIGQLMWVVADKAIGQKGIVHAKRMKSFFRYLLTGHARFEVPLLSAQSDTDADYQKTLQEVGSVTPLPEPLMDWALQGIANLSYDPLPPLPTAASPPAPGVGRIMATRSTLNKPADEAVDLRVGVGVALALALILGLAIAATLIWHREVLIRRCSLPGELGSLTAVRGGSGVPSDSVDLKLELDGKGEPLLLGQGSFAKVYKGRWNGVLVAVKVLKAGATEGLDDFRRECSILERLRHPNIIKYFGMASNAEGQVMMVTEYMQGGDLGTALADDNAAHRRLGWYNNGSHIALEIARGLAYLHHRKVISFDVKPANVLLDRSGKHAKLADVGLAKVLEHSQTMTNMRGTLDYMPPEMFAAYEEDDGEGEGGVFKKQAVTQAVDIYSFGLVLWQLVTGGQPDKILGSLRPPRIPEECPAEIAQLFTACLSERPEQRPRAADLVRVIMASLRGSPEDSMLGNLTESKSIWHSWKAGLSSTRR